jgi:hypothetical protein
MKIHIAPLLAFALAACGSGETSSRSERVYMDPAIPVSATEQAAPKEMALSIAQKPPAQAVVAPGMLIRSGTASVEVDSVELAVARVQRLAQQLGGYVGNASLSGGEQAMRSATLELKVPAARFDQAVGGLRPLGKVENVQVQAEDVGEEFVDLTARTANARRLEERLLGLLATRTGKLEDVLAVERELARVRQEIDTQEGRLRYLRSRVAVSTLNVTLHEPRPVVGAYPGSSPIANAFRDAWRNFIGFMAGLIASLGVLIPVAAILALVYWLVRRLRRSSPPPYPRGGRTRDPVEPPVGSA